MNWKGCGRKLPRPNLRYFIGYCPEGLRKTIEILARVATHDHSNKKKNAARLTPIFGLVKSNRVINSTVCI
jgi:hypothetical protein